MYRAVNRLLRGGNKKNKMGKRTIRVRLYFGCSPPEEENADCRRAMINISEYVLDRHSLANNRNTDGEMCFSCTHLYFPYKKTRKAVITNSQRPKTPKTPGATKKPREFGAFGLRLISKICEIFGSPKRHFYKMRSKGTTFFQTRKFFSRKRTDLLKFTLFPSFCCIKKAQIMNQTCTFIY